MGEITVGPLVAMLLWLDRQTRAGRSLDCPLRGLRKGHAPRERPTAMHIKSDLAATIGNTPLIRLKAASEATGCEILGKADFMNPGQSVKDRGPLHHQGCGGEGPL